MGKDDKPVSWSDFGVIGEKHCELVETLLAQREELTTVMAQGDVPSHHA